MVISERPLLKRFSGASEARAPLSHNPKVDGSFSWQIENVSCKMLSV
jgi:hypothetical protein